MTYLFNLILFPLIVYALPSDVNIGSWYSEPVKTFYEKGYLDALNKFRPSDNASRAEFIELIVNIKGSAGIYNKSGFDDVPTSHKYFAYFETAARQGWLKGAGSCYGASTPCSAYPNNPINRAEAATLMMRAFAVSGSSNAPSFSDNPNGQWYTANIKAAASMCILKGDAGSTKVRPAGNMNRAEMVVMLSRLQEKRKYPDCGDTTISEVKNTLGGFSGPYGIHVTSSDIFVMDSVAGMVKRYDLNLNAKGELKTKEMEFPHSLGIDKHGTILVADHRAGSVFKFASDGSYLGKFNDGKFTGPVHVHIDLSKNIWVTDYKANKVLKFNSNGDALTWNAGSTFDKPHMVMVDGSGNVYVVETGANQVQKFASNGSLISTIDGKEHGGFNSPTAIDIANRFLYVTDTDNNRIEKFTLDGTFVSTVAESLNSPFHAFYSGGKLYIVDTGNKKVFTISQ